MMYFILSEGWRSFRNLGIIGVLMLLVLTITLILGGLTTAGYLTLQDWSRGLLGRFEIEGFIRADASESQISDLIESAQRHSFVKSVNFISRDDALKRFSEDFGNDLLDLLERNPLPASIVVTMKSDAHPETSWKSVASMLSMSPAIEEVVYDGELLAEVAQIYRRAGATVGSLIGIMLVVSIMLSILTISGSIRSKYDLIRIILLSGGTRWMARGSFVVLGSYYGLFAGLVASGVVFISLKFFSYTWGIVMPLKWSFSLVLIVSGMFISASTASIAAGRSIRDI